MNNEDQGYIRHVIEGHARSTVCLTGEGGPRVDEEQRVPPTCGPALALGAQASPPDSPTAVLSAAGIRRLLIALPRHIH